MSGLFKFILIFSLYLCCNLNFPKLRKVVTYIALALYLVSIFGTALPYLEYVTNKDYIANVLCINQNNSEMHCEGKCYLTKKLKENQEKKENQEAFNSPEIKLHFPSKEITFAALSFVHAKKKIPEFVTALPKAYETSIFHPPQSA